MNKRLRDGMIDWVLGWSGGIQSNFTVARRVGRDAGRLGKAFGGPRAKDKARHNRRALFLEFGWVQMRIGMRT
jgi:hypothetical protein